MFCSKCGTKLDEDAKFCQDCGTAINPPTEENDNSEIHRNIELTSETITAFNVILQDAGQNKLEVIKTLMTIDSSISLKTANELVDNLPSIIRNSISLEQAEMYKLQLESIGATVTLTEPRNIDRYIQQVTESDSLAISKSYNSLGADAMTKKGFQSLYTQKTPLWAKTLLVVVVLFVFGFMLFKFTWLTLFLILGIGGIVIYVRNNKPASKKLAMILMSGAGIIAVVFVVTLGIRIIGGIMDGVSDIFNSVADDNGGYSAAYSSESNAKKSNFEWVDDPSIKTSYPLAPYSYDMVDKKIVGTIKNISDKTYSYVTIKFTIYDSSGNQLGTATDSIDNFKSGNTWKFEASSLEIYGTGKLSSFEFLEISYW